ncbi:MAG: S41 family peptidase [Bacteroidota bacterium]
MNSQVLLPTDSITNNNLELFSSVYKKVMYTYPGPVDGNKLMLAGMNEMLKTIDPFTNFFSKDEVLDFKSSLSGKFGGTGMVLGTSPDGIFIRQTYAGRPADRAGLRSADLILEVDSISTKGMSIDEVRNLLRGEPGTYATIEVMHAGAAKKTTVQFYREMITVDAVTYSGMLNDDIAYIKLTRESEDCSSEVKKVLVELFDKHHFKSLVFDLRGNEGGYLREAVKISNLFIDKGNLIVSVRGKTGDSSYFAPVIADYPAISMVLLTDTNTASAGEILSGALQDNDRAVIIGRKTYGKGLVQQVYDLPQGTQLKLTTGHYYTPSGRCIQAFEYDKGNRIHLADSLKRNFKTKSGRLVYSSGGISPDIEIPLEQSPVIIEMLLKDLMIFDFATKYKIAHDTIAPLSKFHLTENDYKQFTEFVKSKKFNYTTETENKLASVKETAEKEGYWKEIQSYYTEIENHLQQKKEKELLQYKSEIKRELEKEIISRYYFEKGRAEAGLSNDKEVIKAIEMLKDSVAYKKTLGIK